MRGLVMDGKRPRTLRLLDADLLRFSLHCPPHHRVVSRNRGLRRWSKHMCILLFSMDHSKDGHYFTSDHRAVP